MAQGWGQWCSRDIMAPALPEILHFLKDSLLSLFDLPKFHVSQLLDTPFPASSYGLFVFPSLRKTPNCLYCFDGDLVLQRKSLPVAKPIPLGCLLARGSNMSLRAWLGMEWKVTTSKSLCEKLACVYKAAEIRQGWTANNNFFIQWNICSGSINILCYFCLNFYFKIWGPKKGILREIFHHQKSCVYFSKNISRKGVICLLLCLCFLYTEVCERIY